MENYIVVNGKRYSLDEEHLKLIDRKIAIKKQMKELEKEMSSIDEKINSYIIDDDIEICSICDFSYIVSSESSLVFSHKHESINSDDIHFKCICGNKILRHSSFLKALNYMKSKECMNNIIENFKEELSDKALKYLVEMLNYVSVPSFVVKYDISHKNNSEWKKVQHELLEKDFIRVIEVFGASYFSVIVNARKLYLYPDNEIFDKIQIQRKFNTPYLATVNKRANRIKKLPNTFSNEEKQRLLERFNNKCAFTGKEVNLHIDHVIPIAWEIEGTVLSNMLPLWSSINSSKHDNNVFEWYKDKGSEYEVNERMFIDAITYIAKLNNMSFDEYKEYVYKCEQDK